MKFKQFINEIRNVKNFDDIKTDEPVVIRAWHGTSYANQIKKEGFKVPEHEINPLVQSVQAKFKNRTGSDVESMIGRGVYFTDSKRTASNYGTPIEIDVTLKKPYVIGHGTIQDFRELDLKKLKSDGYDGIIVQSGRYGIFGGESYRQGVAFNPNNVKVATDKFKTTEIIRGAKVKDILTGERGVIKDVIELAPQFKQYHNNVKKYMLVIRFNKSGTKYNVGDMDVEVIG
jgi:hypothetical protein